jgi:hypothetical protein
MPRVAKIKKQKKENSLGAIFLAVVVIALVAFTLYLIFFPDVKKVDVKEFTYNGFSIAKIGNEWHTQVIIPGKEQNLYSLQMRYSPKQVEDIAMEYGIKEKLLHSKQIYLTTDANMSSKGIIGMIEVGRVLGDKYDMYDIPTKAALISDPTNRSLEITCANASETTTVVYFRYGNHNLIHMKNSCIYVEGKNPEDIIRVSDRLTYGLVGVISS